MYDIQIKIHDAHIVTTQYDWHWWYKVLCAGWPLGFFHGLARTEDKSLLFRVQNGMIHARTTHPPEYRWCQREIDGKPLVREYAPQPATNVNVEVVLSSYVRGTGRAIKEEVKPNYLPRELFAAGFKGEVQNVSYSPTFCFRSDKIRLPVANYTATLQIEDWHAFMPLIVKGIGRDKSCGCGMIVMRG